MKKLFKLGSLLTMVMLLGMGTMVTSCGDDDDEGGGGGKTINKVVYDGKELTVVKAVYNLNDLNNNDYDLYLDFSDGTELNIQLSGDKHDNQLIDMTKPETDLNGWYWYFEYMDAEFHCIFFGAGDAEYPNPCDAGSTMKVRCLNKETGEFEVEFKVIQDGHTMNGYYKGTFKPFKSLEK